MSKMTEKRKSLGLSALSSQVYRKVTKKGFEFCLMVVGESGLGKSTLVNSLFLQDGALDSEASRRSAAARVAPTVELCARTMTITEKGVQLRLTIVDTPGFGDGIDNSKCWEPIVKYVDNAHKAYLRDESKVDRSSRQDDRVHCCLYFIAPTGHGLKPLDIQAMKALHEKVNIVPVIAKADTLTKKELEAFKSTVSVALETHGIQVFRPLLDDDDDDETYNFNMTLTASIPFAVVGSNSVIEIGGRSVRGRQYAWGTVEVDNEDHCDFQMLRTMLVRTHLQDLKDYTIEVLYENFRTQELGANPALGVPSKRMSRVAVQRASSSSTIDFASEEIERKKRELEEKERKLEAERKQFEEQRKMMEAFMAQQKEMQAQSLGPQTQEI